MMNEFLLVVMNFCRNTPLSLNLLKICASKRCQRRLKVILYFLRWCFSLTVCGKNLKTFFSFNLYSYIFLKNAMWWRVNILQWFHLKMQQQKSIQGYFTLNKWGLFYYLQSHKNILICKICCKLCLKWFTMVHIAD